jgi:PilZ domain-containing protein
MDSRMTNYPVAKRRSQRLASRRPASMVVNLATQQKRTPCLVVESSKEGFRVRASLNLRRGQMIELIFDEDRAMAEHCSVVWVGKAGTKHEGEAGLETVQESRPALFDLQ